MSMIEAQGISMAQRIDERSKTIRCDTKLKRLAHSSAQHYCSMKMKRTARRLQ